MALPIDMNLNPMFVDQHGQITQAISHHGWYEYHPFTPMANIVPCEPSVSQVGYQPPFDSERSSKPPTGFDSKEAIGQLPPTQSTQSIAERSYLCSDCGSTFSNSSNLRSHARIHSGEKPYVCDLCGCAFVQSSNLKTHKRTHTGERPYVCQECGVAFSRSSHLVGHKRTHTGERPYMCAVCALPFISSTHLRCHMRKHTKEKPFLCQLCPATFAQNAALQIHVRTHTGERPFICQECDSSFRSSGDLRSHRKLHTHARPFPCERCSGTFKTFQYLQKHQKKCGAPPSGKKRGRPRKAASNGSKTFCMKMRQRRGRRKCHSDEHSSQTETGSLDAILSLPAGDSGSPEDILKCN